MHTDHLKTALAALMLTLTPAPVFAQGSLVCETPAEFDPDIKEQYVDISGGNISLQRIASEYRGRWDAAYVRAQCEAFAAGEDVEITCLNGKRDWGAIKAMIPEDFFGQSVSDLAPEYRKLQEQGDGYSEAADYCREVGAIE